MSPFRTHRSRPVTQDSECKCGPGARWVLDQEPEGSVLAVAPPKVWCRCANCGDRRALLYYEDPKLRAKLTTAVELINDARAVMFDLQVRADLERADRAADAWCGSAQAFVDGEPSVAPPQDAPAVHARPVRHERLSAQIAFLREHFRNDGAEGETVWAVAEVAEKLAARVEGGSVAPEKSDKTFAEVYSEEVEKALNEENERLRDRIEALEGGIVAENARVVREHNALRAEIEDLKGLLAPRMCEHCGCEPAVVVTYCNELESDDVCPDCELVPHTADPLPEWCASAVSRFCRALAGRKIRIDEP